MQDIILAIRSPSDYEEQINLLKEIILDESGKNTIKRESQELLEVLNEILINDQAAAYTRFACLLVARDLFSKKYLAFISSLSSSKLLKSMTEYAKTIDPKKSIEDKGAKMFRDPDLGNQFMRLILESIQRWSQRYPLTSSQTPSKFKQSYNELMKLKIDFPKTMEFYNDNIKKQKQKANRESQKVQQKKSQTPKSQTPMGQKMDSRSAEDSIKQSLSKIQGFIRFIQQCDDEQQLFSEIQRYHKLFVQQHKNNEVLAQKVLSEQLVSEQMVGLLMLVNQFYINQNGNFVQYLSENVDLKSYIDKVMMDAGTLQEYFKQKQKEQGQNPNNTKNVSNRPSITQKQQYEHPKVQQPKVLRKKTSESKLNPQYQRRAYEQQNKDGMQPTTSVIELFNAKQLEDIAEQGQTQLNQFWSNMKPTSGFGAIKRQIQRQLGNRGSKSRSKSRKAISKSRRVRGDFSPTPSDYSKAKQLSIFSIQYEGRTPNNDYSGRIIQYRNQYGLGGVNQYQGRKRIRKSNLQDKGILFQNQMLQIGYKTQPCYQQVNGYKVSLKIFLYYGNKSQSTISKFQVEFQGDENSLLFRTPQHLQQQISPGHQIKQQLIIIPIKVPFDLISINVQYAIGRQFPDFTVYLPNSLLKYMNAHPVQSHKLQEAYNRYLNSQLCTEPFNLSRDFELETLQKLFPKLIHLTRVQDFTSQKNYNELVLGLLVLLVDSDEYLVKINLRPNASVVLQLVMLDDSDESERYAKFLLQSLQFVLQSS